MKYGEIGEECWAALCHQKSTHILTTRLWRYGMDSVMDLETAYCFNDALYFAAYLPYRYPNEHEFVSIAPSAEEYFKPLDSGPVVV